MFNAKTYDSEREIEESVIGNYKHAILSIYNTLKNTLDLSLLNSIIIPEDYKTGLFEFQRNNGHEEFVTENEYGQGFAQVVSSKSIDDKLTYNVIINKTLVFALVGDDILSAIKVTFDAEQYETLLNCRQLAINTLCHEFAHVHEYSMNNGIEWLQSRKLRSDLHSQYLQIAVQCWSEYFASRTVSGTYLLKIEDCIEIINTCKEAEKMLQEKRSTYNRGLISLDDFVFEFH